MGEFENPYGGQVDRDQLIVSHVPLLKHVVGRMIVDLHGSIERDDLVGWGMLGLIHAADSFEPARGLKFSTYAFPKIRGAILDELRRLDFLPRGRRERVRDLDRVVAELEQRTGTPPALEEIASALSVSARDVDEILLSARSAVTASLDEGLSPQLQALLADPSDSDPQQHAEKQELAQLLTQAISELPEQEKSVITLYYAEGLFLRDIGEILGVTESRVSQIHTRALFSLNRALAPAHGNLR